MRFILVIIVVFCSCKSVNKTSQSDQSIVPILDSIYQNAIYLGHPYLSQECLRAMKERNPEIELDESTNEYSRYISELLNSGNTEEAIALIERIFQNFPHLERIGEQFKIIHETLAIAYLRLGEQQNCIQNHSAESCNVPLQGKGFHIQKHGSSKALEIYKNLLDYDPNDSQSKWLYNVAAMTLDKSPDELDGEYVIPKSTFECMEDFPAFNNRAIDAGVDVNMLSGSSILEDFNEDGIIDILVSSWGYNDQIQYLEALPDGGYENKTKDSGLIGQVGGLHIIPTDINNDGRIDVIILRGGWVETPDHGVQPNSLLLNLGNGRFQDITIASGFLSFAPTQTAVSIDFNLDGYLDVFIGNESGSEYRNNCEVYINQKNNTYQQVAEELSLELYGFYKGVTTSDFNNDNRPDLFMTNLRGENIMLLNVKSDNRLGFEFKKVDNPVFNILTSGFPTHSFDINNDGWEDILAFTLDHYAFVDQSGQVLHSLLNEPFKSGQPRLFLNDGNGDFSEASTEYGLDKSLAAMGMNVEDINNDGFKDFYIGTGAPDYKSIVPNRMFINKAGQQFTDVTFCGRFGMIQKGHGIGFADMDNDGDQDIYAVMGGSSQGDIAPNVLFENPGFENQWITIRLEGSSANKLAIGAKIKLEIIEDGIKRMIYHNYNHGASFGNNSLQAEIGIGKAQRIESLQIKWPNATNEWIDYGSISPNKVILISEDSLDPQEIQRPTFTFQKKNQTEHQHHH